MNYYFFPRCDALSTSVTLANYSPRNGVELSYRDRYVHVCWLANRSWYIKALRSLSPGQSVTIDQSDLDTECPSETEASLFFFLYPRDITGVHNTLPMDDVLNSAPAWRANVRLSSPHTSISFQGEYPAGMMAQNSGSVVSFVPFIQTEPDVVTKILFVNLSANPIDVSGEIRVIRAHDRSVLLSSRDRTNRCTEISLSSIAQEPDTLVVVISEDILGAPIYLSHNQVRTQMSFEHTHPPAELFLWGNRKRVQDEAKNWWLENSRR